MKAINRLVNSEYVYKKKNNNKDNNYGTFNNTISSNE